MAKLMLIGKRAQVELKVGQDDGDDGTCVIAQCVTHAANPFCIWSRQYDDLADASEYAEDHADNGSWT